MSSNSKKSKKDRKEEERKKGDEDELISQFCAITGASAEVGESMLEACNQNLNMAVEMHMDNHTTAPKASTSAGPSASTNSDDVQVIGDDDSVRAPIKPKREVLVQEASLPTWARLRSKRKGARSVFDTHRDFGSEIREQEAMVAGTSKSSEQSSSSRISHQSASTSNTSDDALFAVPNSLPQTSSAAAAAARKKKTLADLFRRPYEIMFNGTFEQAKEEAKKQGKWLLIDLQNVQEFNCQTLNRDVWNNPAVRRLIKENFLFWQVTCDSDAGSKYQQYYKVFKYPHVSVLNPRTGECLETWNTLDEALFSTLVSRFLQDHPDFVNANSGSSGSSGTSSTHHAAAGANNIVCKKSRGSRSTHEGGDILDVSESDQIKAAIAASLSEATSNQPGCRTGADSDHSDSDTELAATFSSDDSDGNGDNDIGATRRGKSKKGKLASSSSRSGGGGGVRKNDASKMNGRLPARGDARSSQGWKRKDLDSDSEEDADGDGDVGGRSAGKQRSLNDAVSKLRVTDRAPAKKQKTGAAAESAKAGRGNAVDGCQDAANAWKSLVVNKGEDMKLLIRQPEGERHEITVTSLSTLQVLHKYCQGLGHPLDGDFELVQHFPKKNLSDLKATMTIKEAGLRNRDTIFIQHR